MKFTVLGSGTILPDPARSTAAFLVESAGERVLVDGGPGTLRRLAEHGVDPRSLDAGVYSHRHPDHCGELVGLLFSFKVDMDGKGRRRDYPIWAGEGFGAYLRGLQALHPGWLRSERWEAVCHELSLAGPQTAALPGGVGLTTRPAKHSGAALHLRFDGPDGQSVVFSGDTGPSDELVELSRGVDLLVTECAIMSDSPGHLNPDQVRELVRRAQPKRVLLTHLYPEVDPVGALACVAAAGVPVSRAFDRQVVTL